MGVLKAQGEAPGPCGGENSSAAEKNPFDSACKGTRRPGFGRVVGTAADEWAEGEETRASHTNDSSQSLGREGWRASPWPEAAWGSVTSSSFASGLTGDT